MYKNHTYQILVRESTDITLLDMEDIVSSIVGEVGSRCVCVCVIITVQ